MSKWKETDFGNIPSTWDVSTLGNICQLLTDGSHLSPKPTQSGHYMASVKDMRYNHFSFDDCKTISSSDFEFLIKNNCSPKYGDILLSKDGANCLDIIFVYKQHEEIVLLSSIAIARLKDGFDPDFYRYFLLSSNTQQMMRNNFVSGSAIPRVILKDFKNVPIPIVDYFEQKSIVEILSSLDDKIDLLQNQNKTLEKLAQTIFRQWFIEEAEEQSEKQLLLDDLIATVSYTHKFPADKIVFLNTSDIYQGDVLIHEAVDVKSLPGQAKKSIQKDDILFSEIRPANGRYAYIDFDAENYVVSTKLMVLRSKNVLNQAFIYFYLTNSQTVDYLQMLAEARSGTFPQITFDQLKDLKINIPSDSILKDALKWCEIALEKIKSNTNQIKTLTQLRNTLLPKLMSGEVRVNI